MKFWKLSTAVAALVLSCGVNAATVGFNNSNSTFNLGDTFSLTVQGSDFGLIVGGGLDLSFDASILQVNTVTINQSVFEFYIGDGTEEGVLDNSFGELLNTSFNTFFGATGNFDIMNISFIAVGAGQSDLVLSESALWVFADELGGYYGNQVVFDPAVVNVSAVPVPAAIWMFGSGLLGLFGFARKKIKLS